MLQNSADERTVLKLAVKSADNIKYTLDTSKCVRSDVDSEINASLTFNTPPVLNAEGSGSQVISCDQAGRLVDEKTSDVTEWFKTVVVPVQKSYLLVYGHTTAAWMTFRKLKLWVSDTEFWYGVAIMSSVDGVQTYVTRKFTTEDEIVTCSNSLKPDFEKQEGDRELVIKTAAAFPGGTTSLTMQSETRRNPFSFSSNSLSCKKGTSDLPELAFRIELGDLPITRLTFEQNKSYMCDAAYVEQRLVEDDLLAFKSPVINCTVEAAFDSTQFFNQATKLLLRTTNSQIDAQYNFRGAVPTAVNTAVRPNELCNYQAVIGLLTAYGLLKSYSNFSVLIKDDLVSGWSQIGYLELYTPVGRYVPLYMERLNDGGSPIKSVFKHCKAYELPADAATDFNDTTGKTTITKQDLSEYQLGENEYFAWITLPSTLGDGAKSHEATYYCDPFYRDGYHGLLRDGVKTLASVYKIEFEGSMIDRVTRVRFKTVRYTNTQAQVILSCSEGSWDSGVQAYEGNVFDFDSTGMEPSIL